MVTDGACVYVYRVWLNTTTTTVEVLFRKYAPLGILFGGWRAVQKLHPFPLRYPVGPPTAKGRKGSQKKRTIEFIFFRGREQLQRLWAVYIYMRWSTLAIYMHEALSWLVTEPKADQVGCKNPLGFDADRNISSM